MIDDQETKDAKAREILRRVFKDDPEMLRRIDRKPSVAEIIRKYFRKYILTILNGSKTGAVRSLSAVATILTLAALLYPPYAVDYGIYPHCPVGYSFIASPPVFNAYIDMQRLSISVAILWICVVAIPYFFIVKKG